jgi:hypothetical protein
MANLKVGESRPETPEEEATRLWFAEQEKSNIAELDAGARQIIQLVTTLYGLMFGVLALGKDSFEASLLTNGVLISGTAAVVFFLLAVVTALVAVLPIFKYRYNPAKPASQKETYEQIRQGKAIWLRASVGAFALGLVAFAWLILAMLLQR